MLVAAWHSTVLRYAVSNDPHTVDKTVYVGPETDEWITSAAEKSDRSESYVMRKILEAARSISEEPPDSFDRFMDDLETRLEDD